MIIMADIAVTSRIISQGFITLIELSNILHELEGTVNVTKK